MGKATICAYRVTNLYVDMFDGSVLASITFKHKAEEKAYIRPMPSLRFAFAYIDGEARDWFMGALEDYVNHKSFIINENNKEQFKELQLCRDAYVRFEKLALKKVCEQFLKGYNHFANILPNPNNDSHQSSAENLQQLKGFCEWYLKFLDIREGGQEK